jgi:hypothetical protein
MFIRCLLRMTDLDMYIYSIRLVHQMTLESQVKSASCRIGLLNMQM